MIRFFISIALVAILSRFIHNYGGWYLVVLAGFFGALPLKKNVIIALFTGFLGGVLGWYWLLHSQVETDLATRMAELIGIGSATKLMWISCAIGGLIAGLGAAMGNVLKGQPKENEGY